VYICVYIYIYAGSFFTNCFRGPDTVPLLLVLYHTTC